MAKPNTRDYVPVDAPGDNSTTSEVIAGVSGVNTAHTDPPSHAGVELRSPAPVAVVVPAAAEGEPAAAAAGGSVGATSGAAAAAGATATAPAVIQIKVRTLTGQQIECELPGGDAVPNNTIADLKAAVENVQGVPPAFQRLIYAGRELRDAQKLEELGIHHGHVVHLVLRQNPIAPAPAPAPNAGNGNVQIPIGAALAALAGGAALGGAPLHDPARCLAAFQLARVVKLFAVVDACFLLIWSLGAPILLVAVALCIAGWYGATKFRLSYVILYVLYLVGAIVYRIYWIADDGGENRSLMMLLLLGILVECYILHVTVRFGRLLRELTPADRAELVPDAQAAPVLPVIPQPQQQQQQPQQQQA